MSVLYVVLPLALVFSVFAVATFLWALRGGQFDDLESPAHRMLHDDQVKRGPIKPSTPKPAELALQSGSEKPRAKGQDRS